MTMNDGILSQEEIDALLKGENIAEDTTGSNPSPVQLSEFECDTLGEIGNISMGTAATTLSTLLRQRVAITTPDVSVTSGQQLRDDYPIPYVVVEVQYTEGLRGANILVIKEEDACIIANLMMGGDGTLEKRNLDEIQLSAVGEAMNQMMGSATTSLSSMFNRRIDIAPPRLTLVDLGKEELEVATNYDFWVRIKFKMEIGNLVNSEIMQIIPLEAVRNMIDILMGNTAEEASLEGLLEAESAAEPSREVREAVPPISRPESPPPVQQPYQETYYQDAPTTVKKGEQFAVQPVQFAPLRDVGMSGTPSNISLIMDVPLDITVELGKSRKTIKEILELHQGAIIQLDKLAGEPVDMLVNGKLIAKGEVVVIDESYGIRITAIISPMDRMNKLQ
jgi:flagellar motor switch protein FliN/FliY